MPAALGLSTYRWNNNIKSVLLLLAFPALLLALLGGVFFVFGIIYVRQPGADSAALFQSLQLASLDGSYSPFDLAQSAVVHYWPLVLGIAVVWVLVGYAFSGAMIHAATGGRPVTRNEMPGLYNMLENLCISRGLKMPALYVMDSGALNAFASGINEKNYSITITRGLADKLDDREMEAVLAHELTHIVNHDCRLLIVTVVLVGMVSFAAQMMWRGMRYSQLSRNRRGGGAMLLLLVAGIMLMIGYGFALVLRFAISRRREYLADAGSVELTKNPEALISALRKISEAPHVADVPPEVRQMFIENPPSPMDLWGLFATHPPLKERVAILQRLGGLPTEGRSIIPPSGAA
ncbi:MAG: M48 family metallopeptidase [Bdellovibrionales bacterium]